MNCKYSVSGFCPNPFANSITCQSCYRTQLDGLSEGDAESLAKELGNSLVGQMEQLRKATDDMCKTALQGMKTTLINGYTESLIIESQKYCKYLNAPWITKWYHRKIYRKAKYARIKLERFIKQNYYNNDRSDNR